MKKIILGVTLVVSLFLTTGCGQNNNPQVKTKSSKKASSKIPKNSRFSRLEKGMGMKQVTKLVGKPTDKHRFMTGKSFIPFYFGSDSSRTVYYYKRQGELQFNARGQLVKIVYDRSEDGYR